MSDDFEGNNHDVYKNILRLEKDAVARGLAEQRRSKPESLENVGDGNKPAYATPESKKSLDLAVKVRTRGEQLWTTRQAQAERMGSTDLSL